MKMTLLCAGLTGHVLAAVTRSAEAETIAATEAGKKAAATEELAQLVGQALLVRYLKDAAKNFIPTEFKFAAEYLHAVSVDFVEEVMADPHESFVNEDGAVEGVGENAITPALAAPKKIELTFGTPVIKKTQVWMNIPPPAGATGEPEIVAGVLAGVPGDDSKLTLNLLRPVLTGAAVLILAAGFRPIVATLP